VRYQRFRLQIVAGPAASFTIHASSPRGEGRAPFIPPFKPEEAGALQTALWRSLRNLTAEEGDRPARSPASIGERLFTSLFPGEILRLYERSLDLLEADPEAGLRLELMLDPRDPSLAAFQELPWELLHQPDNPESPALSRRRPIVRYLAVPRPIYAAPRPTVLRIVAVAANPRHTGLAPLNLARELRNLRKSMGSASGLDIVTPRSPTLAALRQTLLAQECHVLHFMGHGGSMEGEEERVLFFETEDGNADPVSGTDLINKLADFPRLRLVVLNACESAAGGAGFDPFAGVASSLVLGGLPAVVAMQLPVSDQAAIVFSQAFYQQLATGDPVDAAVAEGRQAVHSADRESFEWATPVLFMRTPNGELYPEKDIVAQQPVWRRWVMATLLMLGLAVGLRLFVLSPREPQGRRIPSAPRGTGAKMPEAPEATLSPVPTPSQATSVTAPTPTQTIPAPAHDKTPEVATVRPASESPVNVTLHDGEQTTLLSDQASLAVAFNELGQERFVTVTVNGEPHAALSANERFAFTAGGKRYSVYVLSISTVDRSVRLRVARSQ
jgi:hypothetical protein